MEFVLPPVAEGFNIYAKSIKKWTARLPLSKGCFSISQAGVFMCYTTTVGLFWGIIFLPWFYVPSCDFFPSKFCIFIVYESAAKMGIFGRLKAE